MTSLPAALVAGAVTSLHCAGMCGPLSCALAGATAKGRREVLASTAFYHAGRAASYALLGGILGSAGRSAAVWFSVTPARVLPWAFAALFLLYGLGAERWVPSSPRLSAFLLRAKGHLAGKGAAASLAGLGLLSPLLPCGPLYLAFGVALFAGSFLQGAGLMLAFAAGTIPLYWLLQTQYFRLQARFSPNALRWARQGLALAACVLLAWRAAAGGSFEAPGCPMCH